MIDQNGVLTSYQVRYNGSGLDITERSLNLSINTMSVILTGLLPNVYYCVMIRVENGAGLSEFSSPNCASTQEAGIVFACEIFSHMSVRALLRNLPARFYPISHVGSLYGVDVHCQIFSKNLITFGFYKYKRASFACVARFAIFVICLLYVTISNKLLIISI